jgi:4'-phosphopantetheinyl transferase
MAHSEPATGGAFLRTPGFHMLDQAIHLFLGLLEEVDTPEVRAACMATLSPVERQRAERFIFERHRRQFLLAHGLVRAALSRIAPETDPFRFRYGRPFVAARPLGQALHFSLSHTEDCVACVISSCEAVGIDVEATDRLRSPLAIAERAFSPTEIAALRALPSVEQTDRFFDYWTLKEAYLKARGLGLGLPLNRFSMLIGQNRKIRITFAPDFGDDASRWCFMQGSPSPRHRLAVADGSGLPGGIPIIAQTWPLP